MSSFRLRRADADDAEAIVALVAALDVALLGSTDYARAELEEEWRGLDEGDRFVVDDAGTIVGYGTLEQNDHHGFLDGYVHPERFGAGIGSFLVDELERMLGERGAVRVQAAVLSVDARGHELLLAHGYGELRRFWQLRIELDAEPRAPRWPQGVTVSRFDPADAEAFHEAYELAYQDHWQYERLSFERWHRENVEREDFRPELWAVVRDGAEIVAGTICVPERMGAAWISRLFTRREWRRRGLGEALLHDAFGTFWRLGKHTVGLGVDAESDTGAQRLYERAGMRVHWSAVVFEKELAVGPSEPRG
jgi:GNAT superfamily N-acetyltransferase